jgi:hypothetical protein
MANVSLPLCLAFAVYWKLDMLPCDGFCEISELLTVPRFLI